MLFLCVLPVYAQEAAPASAGAANVPAVEQVSIRDNFGIEPAAAGATPNFAPLLAKNDRLFYVMPNYLTVEGQDQVAPVSAGTKFGFTVRTMSDPMTVSLLGVIALMGQAQNSDPSYGQGLRGYGKRYTLLYANTGIGTLMTASVFPTLLHQDPRYFQLGTGGGWHRVKYAVSRIFITRSDSGVAQFNYSEVVGTAVAAGIANVYLPQNQRTAGNAIGVWGTDILLNTVCNVAKEFWPDVRRKIHEHREAK